MRGTGEPRRSGPGTWYWKERGLQGEVAPSAQSLSTKVCMRVCLSVCPDPRWLLDPSLLLMKKEGSHPVNTDIPFSSCRTTPLVSRAHTQTPGSGLARTPSEGCSVGRSGRGRKRVRCGVYGR